ncbi:histidine kinase [Maribacter litopenaei]|uniref:Histidine kinase n=1 Tax=Maribacter litopenaei TaxID=2976127 RepID=A0ABY5YAC7_9FLAO|nr:histidine kinase [Maribacter litopenaei]UWX54886.1 histidine kinase [Maribacter litopenaei]
MDTHPKYPLWLKIPFEHNSDSSIKELVVTVLTVERFQYFEVTADTIHSGYGGSNSRFQKSDLPNTKHDISLRLLNARSGTLYLKLVRFDQRPVRIWLYEKGLLTDIIKDYHYRVRGRAAYYAAYAALLFFTGLFFMLRFYQYRQSYLLWYGLYLVTMGIFTLPAFERLAAIPIFFDWFPFPGTIQDSFRPVPWLFFTWYLKDILTIRPSQAIYKYYQFFRWIVLFGLFGGLLVSILNLTPIIWLPVNTNVYLLFPTTLAGVVLGWHIIRGPDAVYRLIGTGMLLIGLASFGYLILRALAPGSYLHLVYEIPILIELFLLNQAIGLKMKWTNRDLVNVQKQLVLAEQENVQIEKNLNEGLQRLVEEKTEKIEAKSKALLAEETLKIEAEFAQKIANAELKALKARMNPHFIFNCLNAIRNLVEKGQEEQAMEYLTVFASFIRKVLSYSEVRRISLEEELELCTLYLTMEQLRFQDGFEFEIRVNEGTAVDFIMVPPMLLQPLLENAIWHGLLHKEGKRKVTVALKQNEMQLLCSIEDNGVGRKYAARLQKSKKRDSMGMKLFLERLNINNQLLDNQYHFEIIDKYENEKSRGTRVNIFFEL